MPRRKAAAAEAAEASESVGPSDAVEPGAERASRSRRAPVRFESSQHPIARRGTKRQRAAASPTASLAEKMEDCVREETFVANYTYDHVGRAARDADATVWVDIPALGTSNTATEAVKGVRGGFMQMKDQQDHIVKKPDAPSPAESAVITLDHQLPTQDSASVGAHLQSSQEALVDSNLKGGNLDFEARGDVQNEKESALPAQTHLLSNVSTAHSASPDIFVDAAQNIIQPSNVAGSSQNSRHAFHPEMHLSHETDERSVRRAVLADSTSPPLLARKGQTESAPELLFFGEDEEQDDNDEALATPAGPSRLADTSPVTKKKAPADRVDREPSERKLVPTVHSHNKVMAGSRSSQNQKDKRVEKGGKVEKPKKAEKERRARGAGEERKKARKVVRRRVEDESEGSQSDDDLTQSLNVDSFVNSTSNKEKEIKRRRNLMRLQRRQAKALRRRQGIESGSSEPSESDSGSTTSSSSDEDDDGVESFVVSDGESSEKKLEKKSQTLSSRQPSAINHRRPPSPPPLSESRLQAYVQSLDSRMRFREYVRWLVLYALDVETENQDQKRLEAVRAKLRDDFLMLYRSLTTSSNRRQFTWYLKHFPHFERRPMSAGEKAKHVGCHACHRKSQGCEYAFTCWGALYHLTTLTKLSKSEHTSSEMSEDSEDHKLISRNEKKERVFTFFLGESCATKASVKHKLYHWERRVLSDVTKLPAFKALRRMQPEDIVAEEIEDIVESYYLKLSRRFNVLKGHTEKLATENFSSYSKIRDRWDED